MMAITTSNSTSVKPRRTNLFFINNPPDKVEKMNQFGVILAYPLEPCREKKRTLNVI
jgi:hypothetical protein